MAKNKSEKIIIQVQVKDSGVSAKIDKVTKATKNLSDAEKINLKLTKQLNAEKQRETMLNNENYVSLQKAKIANMNLAKEKKNLAVQTNVATTATIKGKTQTGLNNAILTEAGRTASDAAYGMQGMANNLGQLLTLMSQHVQTKGGFGASMKELGKSLFGIGGILIGLQLLISYLPQIQKWFKGLSGEVFNLTEAMEGAGTEASQTVGDFEIFIRTIQSSTKSTEEKEDAIKALKEEFPEFITQLDKAGVSLKQVALDTEEAKKQTDLYRLSIEAQAMAEAAREKIQEAQGKKLDAKIQAETKAKELGFKSVDEMAKAAAKARAVVNTQVDFMKSTLSTVPLVSIFSDELLEDSSTSIKAFFGDSSAEALIYIDNLNDATAAAEATTKALLEYTDVKPTDEATNAVLLKKRITDLRKLLEDIKDEEKKFEDDLLSQRLQTQRDGYAEQLEELGKFDEATINKKLEFFDAEIALVKAQEAKKVAAKKQAAKDAIEAYTDDEVFNENTLEGIHAKLDLEMQMEMDAETAKYEKLVELAEKHKEDDFMIEYNYQQKLLALEQEYGEKKKMTTEMVERAKMKAISDFISGSAVLFKKGTKEYKAVAATGATIDALASSVADFKAAAKHPAAVGNPIYPYLRASKALFKGYGTVKKILATDKPSTSGDGGSAAPPSIPPSFNIVGSTGTNQLAEAIGGTTQQPIKAFVVSSDVTTAQQLDRRREESASI